MTVSIVVPVSLDGAERTRNWAWLRDRYRREHPDWELVEHPDPGSGGWSKGRAVNAGVRIASGDTLVVADADVFLRPEDLTAAVDAIDDATEWVVPHGLVYRLKDWITAELTSGAIWHELPTYDRKGRYLARRPYEGPAGGGIVVVTRRAFEHVGGIDERFIGWGGEDVSFARALHTLVGPWTRLGAPLWHLWHQPQPRPGGRAPRANDELSQRYRAAIDDPDAMRALIDERGAEHVDRVDGLPAMHGAAPHTGRHRRVQR